MINKVFPTNKVKWPRDHDEMFSIFIQQDNARTLIDQMIMDLVKLLQKIGLIFI